MHLRHFGFALLLIAAPAHAHETWIQPEKFVCEPDEAISVALKITDGRTIRDAFLKPDRVTRFELLQGTTLHVPMTLADGEAPASKAPVPAGASVILMETDPKHVVLPAAKFNAYLREEGLADALAERKSRAEMQTPAREDYMRCMKALVTTSPKEPLVDRAQGCVYELVLRRQVSRTLTFDTMRHGDPAPNQQVRFWNLDSGKIVKTVRSDKNGRVTLPLPPGRWLATSTTMRRSSELQTDWRSDWASLTWQHWAKR